MFFFKGFVWICFVKLCFLKNPSSPPLNKKEKEIGDHNVKPSIHMFVCPIQRDSAWARQVLAHYVSPWCWYHKLHSIPVDVALKAGFSVKRWGWGFLQEVDLGSWWEGDVVVFPISFWKVTWKFWKLPPKKSSSRNMGADVEVIFKMESS